MHEKRAGNPIAATTVPPGMNIPRLLATTALTALVGVPVTIAPPAAGLSCAQPSTVITRAEQVYTGEIIDAHDGSILVNVTEVWQGGPVEGQVWLEVDAQGWTSWAAHGGEIPDGYASRTTWVFAPRDATVGPCSAWPLDGDMDEYLLPHRPKQPAAPETQLAQHDKHEVTQPTNESEALVPPLAGGIGAAVLAGVAGVVVRRRRAAD